MGLLVDGALARGRKLQLLDNGGHGESDPVDFLPKLLGGLVSLHEHLAGDDEGPTGF